MYSLVGSGKYLFLHVLGILKMAMMSRYQLVYTYGVNIL